MATIQQNTYRFPDSPETGIDARFDEIAKNNPDLHEIGRKIGASYDSAPERTVVGGAVLGASQMEFTSKSETEINLNTDVEVISRASFEVAELRSLKLSGINSFPAGGSNAFNSF